MLLKKVLAFSLPLILLMTALGCSKASKPPNAGIFMVVRGKYVELQAFRDRAEPKQSEVVKAPGDRPLLVIWLPGVDTGSLIMWKDGSANVRFDLKPLDNGTYELTPREPLAEGGYELSMRDSSWYFVVGGGKVTVRKTVAKGLPPDPGSLAAGGSGKAPAQPAPPAPGDDSVRPPREGAFVVDAGTPRQLKDGHLIFKLGIGLGGFSLIYVDSPDWFRDAPSTTSRQPTVVVKTANSLTNLVLWRLAPGTGFSHTSGPGRRVIQEVYPGTGAERAGLKVGDLVLAVNGVTLPDDSDTLSRVMQDGVVGSTLEMTVLRGSGNQTLRLTRTEIVDLAVIKHTLNPKGDYVALRTAQAVPRGHYCFMDNVRFDLGMMDKPSLELPVSCFSVR